ncbi:MAG: MarC family protein [Methanomicrobiaceae archaeon]|nr:MarC family protein [Methanomicrobiaceae archaeon]
MATELPLIDLFLIIFIGMGPVKVLLVYMAATKDADPSLQKKVAAKCVQTAAIVSILLLFTGALLMRILHFSRGALAVAGGIILLVLALSMVLSRGENGKQGPVPEEKLLQMAIYPMGIPLLLNPIGIVALTVFSAESTDPVQLLLLAGMVLVVAIIDYAIFLGSHGLDRYLTHERILVMEKVLGIFLAALAVQLIFGGAADVFGVVLGGH